MFDFLKNKTDKKIKKIDTENIRNYKQAVKTIEFFIATLDWEKSEKAISEITEKETESYRNLIEEIEKS